MLFPFSFMQAQGPSYDPDAAAFFARVAAAGGTLSNTEKTATNQLVLDMKSYGIWTSMKAIYPMVGASAAACAQNLVSASFTGSFTSGWTFASTGVTPNGTSAYMDTTLVPNTSLTNNNLHYSFYSRTQNSQSSCEIGSSVAYVNQYTLDLYYVGVAQKVFVAGNYPTNSAISTNTDTLGFGIGSRTSTTSAKVYMDGVLLGTNTNNNLNGLTTASIYVSAQNYGGTGVEYSSKECAFASIGDGLTDTQASNFYTAVQTFNQTLNRQVGAQIVSDADAQAYINRVYTAGGTLTNTEANAVNQLVIDMKAAGIWTAMKAVYPMVGASAAACAQNLKSSSFTGTFSSGWTFASTGVTPNGTSAYMDSGLQMQQLSNTTNHLSAYMRGSVANDKSILGAFDGVRYTILGTASNDTYYNAYCNIFLTTATITRTGYLFGTSISGNEKLFRNGTQVASKTPTTTASISTQPFYLGCYNNNGSPLQYIDKEIAFASLGDGLTDTQAANFYTCVQTFNTSLSRQV